MQSGFVNINSVSTNVLTYGRWIEDTITEPENIVLLILGNPGVTGFYKSFMEILHKRTGYSIWCVGHAGHETPKNDLDTKPESYGLKAQISHKVAFIEKYVPKNAKLHLIGHSIGSYIILELLKNASIKNRVANINLLFPTIEYMAETGNGKFLLHLKPFVWLVIFLSWIYTILPITISAFMTRTYMRLNNIPKFHLKNIQTLVVPSVLKRVFSMAYEELDVVKTRDDNIIGENINNIRMLYGRKDAWAPDTYCCRLKDDFPEIKAELSDFNHAFVLNESEPIGELVSDWLKTKF